MRWSLKLSELHFVVEHRPGSKIGHVDALSRHVGAVMLKGSIDKYNIQREQEKDDFCVKQNPVALSRKSFSDMMTVSYIGVVPTRNTKL
jgi:hypothetical protein